MDLYILRHGIAVDHGTPGYEESERPLTPEGRTKLKKVVRGLKTLEVEPGVVVSSPLVRARQTAEMVVEGLGLKRHVAFTDLLTPDGPYSELLQWLDRQHGQEDSVMLVGHEPHLSGLVSFLLTGDGRARLELKKAGLCRLQVEDLQGAHTATLCWLLTPRQMGLLEG
ncbi:MAG TPA: phosphohistidine phosphatase SixA [Candidatus Xenobia bacterium]